MRLILTFFFFFLDKNALLGRLYIKKECINKAADLTWQASIPIQRTFPIYKV